MAGLFDTLLVIPQVVGAETGIGFAVSDTVYVGPHARYEYGLGLLWPKSHAGGGGIETVVRGAEGDMFFQVGYLRVFESKQKDFSNSFYFSVGARWSTLHLR